MQIKALFGTFILWTMLACMSFSVPKRIDKMAAQGKSDKVAADEKPSMYPALDLEDLCKKAKNPKCEAIIDNFCVKSCRADLCAKHGSIRGMCRLMCEAEDLPPQCSKMAPPKGVKNPLQGQQMNPQQMNPQVMNQQRMNQQMMNQQRMQQMQQRNMMSQQMANPQMMQRNMIPPPMVNPQMMANPQMMQPMNPQGGGSR